MEFESEHEARQYLRAHLSSTLPTGEAASVGDELLGVFVTYKESRFERGFALIVPVARWVIREDDLKLVEALIDGAKAGVIGGFLLGNLTEVGIMGGAVGLLASALKLGRQVATKGQRLTPLQFAVLIVLLDPLGATAEQLLAKVDLYTGRLNEAGDVMQALDDLRSIAVSDGTVLSLVSQDARGVWRAAGV